MSPGPGARRVRDDHELSAALVAYLQRGRAASPRADIEAVRAVAAGTEPGELAARVRAVVSESLDVPVDRDRLSLDPPISACCAPPSGHAGGVADARQTPGMPSRRRLAGAPVW